MYEIRKFRSKRSKTNYIILAHAVDFMDTTKTINEVVRRGSYKLTWDIWQKYWYQVEKRLDVPVHYFVELLNDDYVVFNGLALQKQSYYLNELALNGIIKQQYKDALLVMIGDNFKYELLEPRLVEHLANRIISPMCFLYNINYMDRVLTLDDCLTPDWQEKLKESRLNYDIMPMEHFNKNIYELYTRPYMKLIKPEGYLTINR